MMTTHTSLSVSENDTVATDLADAQGDAAATVHADGPDFDFSSASTDSFLRFLQQEHLSIAVSSYDCHRVIVFRSIGDEVDTLLVPAISVKGIAATEDSLTFANITELVTYRRCDEVLATSARPELEGADALYLPRSVHVTGDINAHDLAWGDAGLWLVNSRFNCLCTLDPMLGFKVRWQPFFKQTLDTASAGHLNGMAMHAGKPVFASCFAPVADNWRERDGSRQDGAIIDVERNELILEGLFMPHSPRVHEGGLYVCNSGTGEVLRFDLRTRALRSVITLPCFTRGLRFYKHYMLVCCSQVRHSNAKSNNTLFEHFEENVAGLYIVDLHTEQVVAYTEFLGDVSQLYDIALIPNTLTPFIPGLNDPINKNLYVY